MIEHRNIILTGNLRAIDFFYYAQIYAIRNNINGFIQNGNKSHVYLEVEGEAEDLDKFEKELTQKPLGHYVDAKEVQKGVLRDFHNFHVYYKRIKEQAKPNRKWVKKIAAFFNGLIPF
ncbi:MAG: acylphosphatase [Bacteroidales bacterium]|nr:acylphosphatase [Bacteroidales bacterium]MCF8326835.1 acylphosphatase [Bacteroidales bacterium]